MVAFTNIIVGSIAASAAYGSPLSASCKTYQTQLTNLVQEVPQAQNFCSSWLASKQKSSPIKGVSGAVLTQACKCATQDAASARVLATTPRGPGAIAGAAAASVCKNAQLARILSGLKNVQFFCSTFDPAQWGNRSPIFGATGQAIQQACKCVQSASVTPSASAPPPAGTPPVPFRFCPSNAMQIAPFKAFCNTPLWKSWACSCGTVAQVCFPKQPLTWCSRPATSATPSSSTTAPVISSSSISSIPAPTTTTPAPSSSSSSITTIPSSTSTATSDTPASISETPIVSSSSTEAPAISTSTADEPAVSSSATTDAPVVASSSSSEEVSAATTSSEESVPT